MFNRRGFLRTLLAAPVAAAAAVGLWPETVWARYQRLGVYKKYIGTMRITPEVMEAIRPRKDAFEATMVTYHQRMITQRSGITARAEGSFLPDPDPYGLNR